jgi:hypothetical protein
MAGNSNTDEMLAVHFPNLVKHKQWLKHVDRELGEIERKNGGNTELHARFQGGKHTWTDWIIRLLAPRSEH